MDDASQAYYGYIAMPVFIVTLLASFVYNPMIASLSDQWLAGEVPVFSSRFAKLAGVIALITIACVALAWFLGPPVLGLLYNADMEPFRVELAVLVTGGGFLAITALATLGITIIRLQRLLVPIYAAAAVASFFLSGSMVSEWGIAGASWCYFATMAALAALFAAAFALGVRLLRR